MSEQAQHPINQFVITKEYRRFAEFCDACRRYRYIGLCYGPPGVGKTLSARYYAQWDLFEAQFPRYIYAYAPPEVMALRTVLYTPPVSNSPGRIAKDVGKLQTDLLLVTEAALQWQQGNEKDWTLPDPTPNRMELLIVDEADRLKMPGLEQVYVIYNLERSGRLLNNWHYVYSELVSDVLFQRSRARLYIMRDLYDRRPMGLVLIGMPGIEKRLARFAQLYSRVGFVHQFHALSLDETHFILTQKWQQLGLNLQPEDFTDAEAVAAIMWNTLVLLFYRVRRTTSRGIMAFVS